MAGGDVEGRVSYLYSPWRDTVSLDMGDLIRAPLLNRDQASMVDGEVDGRCRRGDVEGDAVSLCQYSH